MRETFLALSFLYFLKFSLFSADVPVSYESNWASLDSRPLPNWYDEAKIGIFIHWGVFSVPSYISAWFWHAWQHDKDPRYTDFMKQNYKPGFTYQEFAPLFTAEFFNSTEWADIFKNAGAKYVVLTSKHHEGYAMWPSSHGFNWNSMDVGPHRDLVGELGTAVRKAELHYGLYHSLMEWYQPLYEQEKSANFSSRNFPENKIIPTLKELVTFYKPEIIWSDGDWEAPDTYWGSEEFLAWLYNSSPVKDSVVTNDRWGSNTQGVHGGFYNFRDRFNPGVLMSHKWENAMTLDKNAWTHRRDAKLEDFMTPEELIKTIVMTVACGGNILVNVGPTKEGTIPLIMQERLMQMGQWLKVNGVAIYNSVPWTVQNDSVTHDVWYTASKNENKIFAICTTWPGKKLWLGSLGNVVRTGMTIKMLGFAGKLKWFVNSSSEKVKILTPLTYENKKLQWAWTFEIDIGDDYHAKSEELYVYAHNK